MSTLSLPKAKDKMRIFLAPSDDSERITLRREYALTFKDVDTREDRLIEYEIINAIADLQDFVRIGQLSNKMIVQLRRNGYTVIQVPLKKAGFKNVTAWEYRIGWSADETSDLSSYAWFDEEERLGALKALEAQREYINNRFNRTEKL